MGQARVVRSNAINPATSAGVTQAGEIEAGIGSKTMNGETHSNAKRVTRPSVTCADRKLSPSTSRQTNGSTSRHLIGAPARFVAIETLIVPSALVNTLTGLASPSR